MFYDNYIKLCKEMGFSPTRVLADLGISKSSYGHWKKGGEPLNETKKKIADYFGISVKELETGEIKKSPAVKKAEDDLELDELLQDFKDNPELRALFLLSRKATPAELRQYAEVIKALRGNRED